MTHSGYFSKTFLRIAASLSFAAMLLVACTSLQAGEITAYTWSSGVASIASVAIVPPSSPNNDDVAGASPNVITVTQKDYVGIGPIDIEFTVVDSAVPGVTGSVTEYTIVEGVSNSTVLDWSDYEIQLGYGIGASFVLATVGDGLDFDSPNFNSPSSFSPFFPSVTETHNKIMATGGVLVAGGFSTPPFTFNIDVPDGITKFTLRQFPTAVAVPEPYALTLSLLGCIGVALSTRRRTTQAGLNSIST